VYAFDEMTWNSEALGVCSGVTIGEQLTSTGPLQKDVYSQIRFLSALAVNVRFALKAAEVLRWRE
jgi:hypothetical protein